MVDGDKPVVSWNKQAYDSLEQAHNRIKETSLVNADKVKEGILSLIRNLPDNPERYPQDRFKKDNIGNYRAFEAFSYRISYQYTDKVIKILRIRHVRREPKFY